ncbi:MAG: non-heme iron oxygenase ferredoxin subunit [Ghiorsea sp.]|nr:non-heme iron oxygenase ferredoxin subunit [Ghiorsea sp.]
MAEWVDICSAERLPMGERMVVDTDAGKVAIFHLSQGLYAIEDRCSHDNGELASGEWGGDEIICPRHGARFCILNGKALTPPAYEAIEVFAVREQNGIIQIDIDN